jgi:transposase
MDLRKRVVGARDGGQKSQEVAERFEVSASWVRRLMQRRRETGEIGARQGKRGPKPKLAGYVQQMRGLVRQHPDATLRELCEQLPVKVSVSTLWSALNRLELTLKKKSCTPRNNNGLT